MPLFSYAAMGEGTFDFYFAVLYTKQIDGREDIMDSHYNMDLQTVPMKKRPRARKAYIAIAVIFVMINVYLLYTSILPQSDVEMMIQDFERFYYHKDIIDDKEYLEAKAEILEKRYLFKSTFEEFINKVNEIAEDPFTFVIYDAPLLGRMDYTITSSEEPNVAYDIVSGRTGYISFDNFNGDAYGYFRWALEQVKYRDYLILDLRNNYGGATNNAMDIADLLISGGEIYRHNSRYEQYIRYADEEQYQFQKIFIYLNQYSASSSEILALALKENLGEDVVLIGKETYQKGVGQQVFSYGGKRLLFYIVNFRWSVGEKTVEDLNQYLEVYQDDVLDRDEDYYRVVESYINGDR